MGNLIFSITSNNNTQEVTLSKGVLIAIIVAIVVLTIAFYLLRSIGVYKLSKRSGFKYAFLAWIPAAWIYPACKLLGEVVIFGKKIKGFGVYSVVIMAVLFAIQIANAVLVEVPLVIHLFNGGDIKITTEMSILYPTFNTGVAKAYDILSTISSVLSFIEIFITVTLYFNLFKKYWPERHAVAAILSIFGLFPVFVFVIRNKQPVDYQEWVRARYSAYFANNPYANANFMNGQQNPFGANQNANASPFKDFENKAEPVDPFEEFSDKKDD